MAEKEKKSSESKSSDRVTLKIDRVKLLTILVSATLVLTLINSVGILFSGDGATGKVIAVNDDGPSAPTAPSQPSEVKVDIDDDAVLGDENAPVTIIEFSDYQCPFCSRFWSQTLPQIKEEYIDTGKVKFVYRDFPLTSIHPMALPAAEAAECVGEQGGDSAYFEMHDKIFENQGSLSVDNLKAWAKELGYDIDSCLDSGEFRSEVQKDLSDGQSAGGRGTPYFVINGKPLSGAQPFIAFKTAIEAEL